jgi:adenosylcobyric acid synthase
VTAKTLMVQGTASSVGKSILVTALCRIFHQDGYRVAPFKSQNMALNSFVTREGGEIGRAQATQAEAAGIEPSIHMNPVLLKPEADARSQVIVLGKIYKDLKASEYYEHTPYLLEIIRSSLDRLRSNYHVVVIEGAGSPAEVNLMDREIVNMRIAKMAGAPVLLVGDIDRGGVFASLVGTLVLLNPDERDLVKGFIINKFRGDVSLLKPGLDFLEKKTGKPVLGVIPYIRDMGIAQEDSVHLDERPDDSARDSELNISVIRLPHISNYDDFDPFEKMMCRVNYISRPSELNNPDLIILPGTKSTIADLMYLRERGLEEAILRHYTSGVPIIGICGGYQMLGKILNDPAGVESAQSHINGLGLIDCETTFNTTKTTTQVTAKVAANSGLFQGLRDIEIRGYEIHMGQTQTRDQPAFQIMETPDAREGYPDGAVSRDGLVFGSYLHGLFLNPEFTQAFLSRLREIRGLSKVSASLESKDKQYDELAKVVRQNIDMNKVYNIVLGR